MAESSPPAMTAGDKSAVMAEGTNTSHKEERIPSPEKPKEEVLQSQGESSTMSIGNEGPRSAEAGATLMPPPASQGQPVQGHWRQRRKSDVIDSGGRSPGGCSPSSPVLGTSWPKVEWLGPRSPQVSFNPWARSPDNGYGSGGAVISPQRPRDALDAGLARINPENVTTDANPTNAAINTFVEVPTGFQNVLEAVMPVEKDAEEYFMGHPRRGSCIILNNDDFLNMPKRCGSDVDVKNLKAAFGNLGFDVIVHNNKSGNEIFHIMKDLGEANHSDADCLMVAVLTHGLPNGFLWAHDVPYPVHQLWQPFTADKCLTLAGKPKLFFIQACRGEQLDRGVILQKHRTQTDSGTQSYKIPSFADFLLVYSSVEGFYSWRNPEYGTWFIECLCKEILSSAHSTDLLKLLTRVARKVALDYESFNDIMPWQHQCKQVPAFNSMLIRDVVFRPKM